MALRAEESLDLLTIRALPWQEDDVREKILDAWNEAAGREGGSEEPFERIKEEDIEATIKRGW